MNDVAVAVDFHRDFRTQTLSHKSEVWSTLSERAQWRIVPSHCISCRCHLVSALPSLRVTCKHSVEVGRYTASLTCVEVLDQAGTFMQCPCNATQNPAACAGPRRVSHAASINSFQQLRRELSLGPKRAARQPKTYRVCLLINRC